MENNTTAGSALLTALALAKEHGSAREALRRTGLNLDDVERVQGVRADLAALLATPGTGAALDEALAVGFLAGRVSNRPRPRRTLGQTASLAERDDDPITGARGIATPARPPVDRLRAAALHERVAEQFETTARLADLHADAVGVGGDEAARERERKVAEKARRRARRARAIAFRLRSNGADRAE